MRRGKTKPYAFDGDKRLIENRFSVLHGLPEGYDAPTVDGLPHGKPRVFLKVGKNGVADIRFILGPVSIGTFTPKKGWLTAEHQRRIREIVGGASSTPIGVRFGRGLSASWMAAG